MRMTYPSLSNRKLFLCLTAISIAFLIGGAVLGQPPGRGSSKGQVTLGAAVGVPVVGERGIPRTTAEIMAAQQVAPPSSRPLRMPEHEVDRTRESSAEPEREASGEHPRVGRGRSTRGGKLCHGRRGLGPFRPANGRPELRYRDRPDRKRRVSTRHHGDGWPYPSSSFS